MNQAIVETFVTIAANCAVTLLSILAAWLLTQLRKNQQLTNIDRAVSELTAAAEQTVLELKQTVVDDLKAASLDGKLTKEEVRELGRKLLERTMEKMSPSAMGVLQAANMDVNAMITGAGEAMIARMKRGG